MDLDLHFSYFSLMRKLLLSWSTGKDCAWALHILKTNPLYSDCVVVGLLTTFNEQNGRVAMHGTRKEIAIAQSRKLEIPLWAVDLPSPCSNEEYAKRMLVLFNRAKAAGVTHIAYGDLWLSDVRAYRESTHLGTGIDPLFPIWLGGCEEQECLQRTKELAEKMIASGQQSYLVTVDTKQLPREKGSFLGRAFDQSLLDDLTAIGSDLCGERGEFHTVCFRGPVYDKGGGLQVVLVEGEEGKVERGHFHYIDLALQQGDEGEPFPGGVILDAAAFDAEVSALGDGWVKNAQLGEALCPSKEQEVTTSDDQGQQIP
jgi:diphthamide synthase (EF-2-diphthine--ammonia ligase)